MQIENIKIRGSSADRFLSCASSALTTDHPYNPQSNAAGLGSAVHEVLAELVDTGKMPPEVMDRAARTWGVDVDEIERLASYGARAWEDLAEEFEGGAAEVRIDGEITGGTADVLARVEGGIRILDWKSGRGQVTHEAQLLAYALAAVDQFGLEPDQTVTTYEVWVQHGVYHRHDYNADQIEGFRGRLKRAIGDIGRQYAPGAACAFCPRQLECQARQDLIRSTTGSLAIVGGGDLTLREQLSEMFPRVQQLKKAIGQFEELLDLELNNGAIQTADGRQLELGEHERTIIKPIEAWKVITDWEFSQAEIASAMTISKGKLLSTVAKRAKRGQGAAMKREIMQDLDSAGALKRSTFTKRQHVKGADA